MILTYYVKKITTRILKIKYSRAITATESRLPSELDLYPYPRYICVFLYHLQGQSNWCNEYLGLLITGWQGMK